MGGGGCGVYENRRAGSDSGKQGDEGRDCEMERVDKAFWKVRDMRKKVKIEEGVVKVDWGEE